MNGNALRDRIFSLFGFSGATTPTISPLQDEKPVSASDSASVNLENTIRRGVSRFGQGDAPVSTLSGQLAQAGRDLPDPLLPVILSLMETGGGKNLSSANNLFNIGPGIEYPNPEAAIVGGGPENQRGLAGIMREGGPYEKYRQSGDLKDFFSRFTPPGEEYGNPSMEELLARYMALRALFE